MAKGQVNKNTVTTPKDTMSDTELVVTQEPKGQSDVVSISKDTLKDILGKLESIQKQNTLLAGEIKSVKEDNEMLKTISDKARLAKYENSKQGPLVRTARVSFWEDQPILAWQKLKDEVGFRDGRLIVNQQIRLFLDAIGDGDTLKTVDLDYLYWVQNTSSKKGELVEKSSTDNGEYWKVRMEDGREVKLDIRFLNAF